MEFRLLGVMEVEDSAGPIELPSGRGRALLALLALHAGQPVAAERLIDELWSGAPPATAVTVVHGLVSKLRKALAGVGQADSRILETVGNGYRLAVPPDAVDVIRFERLVAEARGEAGKKRSETLSRALALWRGPALVDFTYEPFAQRTIRAMEESRIQASEEFLEAEMGLGRADDVILRLRELIEAHPFRERLHALLMTALYRSGRQAEALAAYTAARRILLDELGIEPGPALRSVEAAILRQDPSLETPTRDARTPSSQETAWLPRERRQVTVAVIDVSPRTDLDVDPEQLAGVGANAAQVATEVLTRHGARIVRSLGDELIAFFGFPASHEDDAIRAVRAVLDARLRVLSHNAGNRTRPAIRTGIETGDIVIAGPGGALSDVVSGPVISTARRLAMAAQGGDVVVGPATLRLVRGAAIVKPLEGSGGWLVLELAPSVALGHRTPDTPIIGRDHEISCLRSAFRRAVRSGAPVRSTVLGDAGIGKSRLAAEVVASLGTAAHAITIRCTPPDDPLGFHPVRQAVVEAAGVLGWRGLHTLLETAAAGATAVDDVASAVALRCPPALADELAQPMRHLLEALARERPLVVILDDLHWADPGYLDLVARLEHLAGSVLLLGLTRPDDSAPPTAGAGVLPLEPLADSEIARLMIDEGGPVTPGALEHIVDLAQGNPLYAEQLLAATSDGELSAIPASLVGLLSMRLDRLGPGERDVLRCAAVGDLDVDLGAVRELLPPESATFVATHLEALVRKRLLVRSSGGRLRFAHVLLQMAAYQSLTEPDRRRFQAALEAHGERESKRPVGLSK